MSTVVNTPISNQACDDANESYCRVVINSVGKAQPSSASAIASGLGLPAATVVSCLYRAPAVLVDKVSASIADNLSKLLEGIGYDVSVQPVSDPLPDAPALFDVALYVKDERQLSKIVTAISGFIGMPEEEASKALLKAPSVILGAVSQATVDALKALIGSDAELVASPQTSARYDLFLSPSSDVVAHRILQDLRSAHIELVAELGLIASDVDPKVIEPIWERYKTSGSLAIVNRDFLRFDINLKAPTAALTEHQKDVLMTQAGIPEDLVDAVNAAAPVALLESVAFSELDELLSAFTDVGFEVQADLITFQILGIEIKSADNRHQLNQVLKGLGVGELANSVRLPYRLPNVYPELQARIIRTTLEDLGVDVNFFTEFS